MYSFVACLRIGKIFKRREEARVACGEKHSFMRGGFRCGDKIQVETVASNIVVVIRCCCCWTKSGERLKQGVVVVVRGEEQVTCRRSKHHKHLLVGKPTKLDG